MHLICSNTGGISGGGSMIFLNANNTTYNNAFEYAQLYRNGSTLSSDYLTSSGFDLGYGFVSATYYITNFTQYKNVRGFLDYYGSSNTYPDAFIVSTDWHDTTIAWTSLGTVTFSASTSGYILVRRLQ
jgi:hypothetical protein